VGAGALDPRIGQVFKMRGDACQVSLGHGYPPQVEGVAPGSIPGFRGGQHVCLLSCRRGVTRT
jgi:hypothetical protein